MQRDSLDGGIRRAKLPAMLQLQTVGTNAPDLLRAQREPYSFIYIQKKKLSIKCLSSNILSDL